MDAARRAGLAQLTFATQTSTGGAKRAEPRLGRGACGRAAAARALRSGSGPTAARRARAAAAAVAGLFARARRRCAGGCIAQRRAAPATRLPVPVIVVGNLIVGGAGKTPTVIALVALLRRHGLHARHRLARLRPARATACARSAPTATRAEVGDEPLLMHRRTGAPVVVGRDRVAAGARAAAGASRGRRRRQRRRPAAPRARRATSQVLVFDERGAGNGWLLPAGPLREPLPRALPAQHARALQRRRGRRTPLPGFARPAHARPASPRSPTGGAASAPSRARAGRAARHDRCVAAAGLARPAALLRDAARARPRRSIALPLPDHHDFARPALAGRRPPTSSSPRRTRSSSTRRSASAHARLGGAARLRTRRRRSTQALLALLPPPAPPPTAEPHGHPPA